MMSDKIKTGIPVLCLLLMTLLLGICTQHLQEFRFYTLEGEHLLVYDRYWIREMLAQPGGIAQLAASFLSQFMRSPGAGALAASLCYGLILWGTWQVLRKSCSSLQAAALACWPTIFLVLCLENGSYRFQGHVAYTVAVLALWGYSALPARWGQWRLITGISLSFLLYEGVGSVALLFSIAACLHEWSRCKWSWLSVSYPLTVVAAGLAAMQQGGTIDAEWALTPLMYYDWDSTYYIPFYAWLALPLMQTVSYGLRSFCKFRFRTQGVITAGSYLFAFLLLFHLYGKVHSVSQEKLMKEQFYAEQGRWDEIIALNPPGSTVYFISYLNLALAQKNRLTECFFHYRQHAPVPLMGLKPKSADGLSLMARVYAEWGYAAAAQQAAFESGLVQPGGIRPSSMKIMIRCNLAYGEYALAEKYIRILEKTYSYRKWAEEQRQFLGRDDRIEADPVLGMLRASIPQTDSYLRRHGLLQDLDDILNANPRQSVARQFREAYVMLTQGETEQETPTTYEPQEKQP